MRVRDCMSMWYRRIVSKFSLDQQSTSLDAELHARRVLGRAPHYHTARFDVLDEARDPSDQAATPHRHEDGVELRQLLKHFFSDRPLPRHDIVVIICEERQADSVLSERCASDRPSAD